jgi:hypothetical protein
MATKLSTTPANVTREKMRAPTGNSIASVATDARSMATIAATTRGNRRLATMGITTRMASVAPKVRTKAGSATDNGCVATRQAATNASVLRGGLR